MAWEGKAEEDRGAGREQKVMQRAIEGGDGGPWRYFESLVLSVPGPGCVLACDIPVDLKLIQGTVSHSIGRPL